MNQGRIARALRVTDAVLAWASRITASLGALVLVGIMLALTTDIVRRAVTGKSISGILGGSEVALVVAIFLGIAYAQRDQAHVATTVVVDHVSPRVAAIMKTLALAAALVFFVWFFGATAEKAIHSVETGEYRFGLVRVPIWPARVAIAIGLLHLALELLRSLLLEAKGIWHPSAADGNQAATREVGL